jgi:glycosyl transferase family 25
MRLVDLFGRTFVLNLPSRADRRREVGEVLRRAGMPWEPGKVEIFEAVRPESAGGFPNAGARGNFMSHMGMLKKARALGVARVLICEDDLGVSPQWNEVEAALVDRLARDDWDLAYIGHYLKIDPPADGRFEMRPYHDGITQTHCYAAHARVFDRLIGFLEAAAGRPPGHPDGGPQHTDGAVSTFRAQNHDVVTLIACPSLAYQRSSRSDITANRWFDHYPVSREIAGLIRQIRFKLG